MRTSEASGPLFEPRGHGLVAFVLKNFGGVLHVLVNARMEGGFTDAVTCLTTRDSGPPLGLTSPRAGLGAAVLDTTVYVVGGYGPGFHGSTTVESYTVR